MQDKNILVNNWLEKSDEALKEARINIENDCLSAAQNRIYYAIFYAVCALGQKNDFVTSKHSQLLGWFNREYAKANLIDRNIGKIYKKSYEFRHKSDYTFTFKPDKTILRQDIEKALQFIEVIKRFIKSS